MANVALNNNKQFNNRGYDTAIKKELRVSDFA